jgi:hypothetical protein
LFGEQSVAVDDGSGNVGKLAVDGARVLAEHLESARLIDRVAFHQNALGALSDGATTKGTFEVVVLGEAPEHDVD